MQKHEFLELFKEATRAAKSAKGVENSLAVSRCVDAMDRLRKAPESLACDLVIKTSFIGLSHKVFAEHKNPKIRSEAKLLYSLWLSYLYATGRKQSWRECDRNRPVVMKRVEMEISSGDSKRDKVREILQKFLSRVASEVVETEMKKRIASCDPCAVAVSVESAMFEELGCFEGTQKLKYRWILFNMGDSNNPDLRRKVLIGEINGESLVTMKREEMASNKIQMEVQQIKEKARFREENRIKTMMMAQADMMMIMT